MGSARISVVMANYNGAAHIAEAVRSVLRQSERSLELILSDDGSTDDSLARAEAEAGGDPRLVILRGGGRTGPAATRNRALNRAAGAWVAIVDSDDLIAPGRLAELVGAAEAESADIAADNLIAFGERVPPQLHIADLTAPRWVGAAEYLESNRLFGPSGQFGYLKPVFRRGEALRYDEKLIIGEDMDLVLRLLVGGARMRLLPTAAYFYRKHPGSISHRLTPAHVASMLGALDRLPASTDPGMPEALRRHRANLQDAAAYEAMVSALKRDDLPLALRLAMSRPASLALLRLPILARLASPRPRIDAEAAQALQTLRAQLAQPAP